MPEPRRTDGAPANLAAAATGALEWLKILQNLNARGDFKSPRVRAENKARLAACIAALETHLAPAGPAPNPVNPVNPIWAACPGNNGSGEPCCPRAGEYNGYGSDGPRRFMCPVSCPCHD